MRSGTPGFVGKKLKEAREARGLTQTSLAELLGVSNRAVSQYENGSSSPHPDIMQKITQILNLPLQFFLSPIVVEPSSNPVFYRSMSSATASARIRAEWKLIWLKRIVNYLQEYVEFPEVNFPTFEFPWNPLSISDEEIENAALELRRFWGLGDGPISNVVYLLENNGVIVSRISLGANSLDGLSNWREDDDRPYIILSSDKHAAARSRFDAAHEIGHQILHRSVNKQILKRSPEFKLMEQQAHRFAGAFLLPATSFAEDFIAPSLDALLVLKGKWNVSIGTMIVRAKDLDLINDDQATRLWRNYARRGYKTREPLDDKVMPEEPELLKQSITLLINESIQTKSQILAKIGLGQTDIEELTSLPPDYLSDRPKIKLTKPKIIPFRRN